MKKISLSMFLLLSLVAFTPAFSGAREVVDQTGRGTGITYECEDEKGNAGNCDFQDLLKAVEKVVKWGVTFTLSFSVVVIAYAGYLYMISGDNPGKRKEANTMLTKVVIGIFFILAAWLIVSLILRALGVDSPVEFK